MELKLDLYGIPENLLLGTSSFSSPDWCGPFYPDSVPPAEYLRCYAEQLRTVEIDATWHAMPARRTVEAWRVKVPPGFVFSLKVPKVITHEKSLVGCETEWSHFFALTDALGEKRGPLLFQFPYVARGADPEEYRTGARFRERLRAFLPHLSSEGRYVVEIRNRTWITPELTDLLRSRNLALALVHYYTMPSASEILAKLDPFTADFSYVRFLGHHKAMDEAVTRARGRGGRDRDWGELLVDRTEDTRAWIRPIAEVLSRVQPVYVYFNNHYAGFAPGSIDLFVRLWKEQGA